MVRNVAGKLHYEAAGQRSPVAWRSFLDEELTVRAQQAALVVIERMRDPGFVAALAEKARRQTHQRTNWSPISPSAGAGLILMYEYTRRCFPQQGWDIFTQQYLRQAAEYTHQLTLQSSALFKGTAGLAFALSQASQGGKRYQQTLARLHQGLYDQVKQRAWRRPESENGVADYDYDVISGAAGTLVYLISVEQPDEYVQATIALLLEYLLWLAEPGQDVGKERWYIPPELLMDDQLRQIYPQGNFNCGMAHGIPGVLAALALTWLAGYRYPGLSAAIAYLADWITEHHVSASWGLDWPDRVPLAAAASRQDWQSLFMTCSAWCYGAPGVSRSLWLAGQALDKEPLRLVAVEAIEATLRRPVALRYIPSPNLCHGVAGLLHICLRFAHEARSTLVREHIPLLVRQLLDAFDPQSPLGFRDRNQENEPVDQPSWLEGASGIASVLLAASTPVEPTWDRVLALA